MGIGSSCSILDTHVSAAHYYDLSHGNWSEAAGEQEIFANRSPALSCAQDSLSCSALSFYHVFHYSSIGYNELDRRSPDKSFAGAQNEEGEGDSRRSADELGGEASEF